MASERKRVFMAADSEERDMWMDAIMEAVNDVARVEEMREGQAGEEEGDGPAAGRPSVM